MFLAGLDSNTSVLDTVCLCKNNQRRKRRILMIVIPFTEYLKDGCSSLRNSRDSLGARKCEAEYLKTEQETDNGSLSS